MAEAFVAEVALERMVVMPTVGAGTVVTNAVKADAVLPDVLCFFLLHVFVAAAMAGAFVAMQVVVEEVGLGAAMIRDFKQGLLW